ncbi:coiled coil [Cryptosporidium sp. chipmunk genotype I]|uniref:coiled coil n=1 Tax=Cryptosporidium sp. chipmunk genotype I TaxID=1280935 RepID=UPI00351A2CA4|nr:coiled coil [Cryptosporidium sp. chipmunk genotype I]
MPILRNELQKNSNKIEEEAEVSSKFIKEKKEKLSFLENNTRNDFNNSLKKIENILINAYNQANSNYNSFFYNINMLTLPCNNLSEEPSEILQRLKIGSDNQSEQDNLRMKILQGVNTELNDSLRMTLDVVLRTYKELEKIQNKIEDLILENRELKNETFGLNMSIQELKNENNKLSRENFYLNEQIKERISTCDKYKNALNKSIKTMKKLYFENDKFNKEISQLENQLVVSKLRVAQHNEELEHIRTLLKYYKNQVKSDYILSPAIEQIIKVEPCRIPSNNKETFNNSHQKNTNIGNILSKLLFNHGSSTRNIHKHKSKKISLMRTTSNNNSPRSSSPCLKSQYDNKKENNKYNSSLTITTPVKLNKLYNDEHSLQSTGIDYCNNDLFFNNQRICKENLFSSDDERFIENLINSPPSITSTKSFK